MTKSRRNFIRIAGGLSASALLMPLYNCAGDANTGGETVDDIEDNEEADADTAGSLSTFGIQLYTLRDLMPGDPKGTLKRIADMGYKQIEGYEGDLGIFWGMEPQAYKDYLDELGLTMVSTHVDISENFAEKTKQAASIGVKYMICPYIGAQKDKAAWQRIVEQFNAAGKTCADNGIRFAYHNHAYTFEEVDGIMPQAYLMDNTDATVDYEMDIYWVVTAKQDPIEWLNKYPNKWRLCHVKDRQKDAPAEEMEANTDLGTGSIDFAKILTVAEDQGMEYYILEQEDYPNSTPLESAAAGAKYMETLKFS